MAKRITMAHGDGGEQAHQLIQDLFVEQFAHHKEATLDAAILTLPTEKIAMSTDSFVVNPIFFPGGNIGKLAVAGLFITFHYTDFKLCCQRLAKRETAVRCGSYSPPSLDATNQPAMNVTMPMQRFRMENVLQSTFNRIAIGDARIRPMIA